MKKYSSALMLAACLSLVPCKSHAMVVGGSLASAVAIHSAAALGIGTLASLVVNNTRFFAAYCHSSNAQTIADVETGKNIVSDSAAIGALVAAGLGAVTVGKVVGVATVATLAPLLGGVSSAAFGTLAVGGAVGLVAGAAIAPVLGVGCFISSIVTNVASIATLTEIQRRLKGLHFGSGKNLCVVQDKQQ